MTTKQVQNESETTVPSPSWITPFFRIAQGRDPLGFQTTTQDRLMPELLPGMLELTRRARYLSFHAFLLDEYKNRKLPTDIGTLSSFIKRCEWDFGLAVKRCPKHCNSSPVGARLLGNISDGPGPFPRGESVESALGGFGLYYRSPLISFEIVAGAGTLLGNQPIPIDVLYQSERAVNLAESFRSAVSHIEYYKKWMWNDDPIPAEVIDEYSASACLCLLPNLENEREAVFRAIFGSDSKPSGNNASDFVQQSIEEQVLQRKRSVAHYLTLIDNTPSIVSSESQFREKIWDPPEARNPNQEFVSGQWAALAAKDVVQESICSVWFEFCDSGKKKTNELLRGLTWEETRQIVDIMVNSHPEIADKQQTNEIIKELEAGSFSLLGYDGNTVKITDSSLEELRILTVQKNTAISGLVVLLELARRAGQRNGTGWQNALHIGSAWQPSVAMILEGLKSHLSSDPSITDTIWWMVTRFILPVHERISYSKMPEFTFRFRWDEGLLHFYNYFDTDRFPLAAIRNVPLASITKDLGLWIPGIDGNQGVLTEKGKAFVNEVFS